MPRPLDLLLVRHAPTAWQAEGRYQGRSDPPLSAAGAAVAAALAPNVAARRPTLVLSSPLQRAVATARPIAAAAGVALRQEPGLVELAFGAWEGLTQAEVKRGWPDLLRAWKRCPDTARPPGGETLAEAAARLCRVLSELTALSPPGPVVLVTHAMLIRLALLTAAARPHTELRTLEVPPGSVHLLRWERTAASASDRGWRAGG